MMIQNNYQRLLVPLLIQRLIIYLLTLKYLKRIKEHESDNIAYTYDNGGNITAITDYMDNTRNQNFTYDHLNRIADAQSPSYGTITYQYNQIGNITYNSQLGSYTYGAKPHAVIQAGANSYAYDANGNMTNRPNQTITYDYDNRPIAINSTTFIYDYAGQRVKKNSTVYIGKHYECTAGACTKYIFAGSQRIASKTTSATYYFHTDHLGSSSVITDTSGNKVQETYYYPFGGTRLNTGNVVKHKYTGQEEDPETGLYYYNARYYDPQLGRFISADSIVGNPRDPQDLNRYTYAGNNPLIYTDPTGHLKFKTFMKAVVVGVVAGAVFVATGGAAGLAAGMLGDVFLASLAAGAAAGATAAALNGGNLGDIVNGAVMGAVLGGFGGAAYAISPVLAAGMILGSAAYATAKGGLNGLGYWAGGVGGAIIGANGAQYAMKNWGTTGRDRGNCLKYRGREL